MDTTNKSHQNINNEILLNAITKSIVNKSEQAHNIVYKHLIASMTVSLIPIPMFEAAALMGIQLKMLKNLCNLYGYKFSETWGKSVIASLLSFFGTKVALVPLTANIAKIIPGIGTASALASMSILSGYSTYIMGKVFIHHFESGGTFLDFNPDEKEIQARLQRYFDEGKKMALKMS